MVEQNGAIFITRTRPAAHRTEFFSGPSHPCGGTCPMRALRRILRGTHTGQRGPGHTAAPGIPLKRVTNPREPSAACGLEGNDPAWSG